MLQDRDLWCRAPKVGDKSVRSTRFIVPSKTLDQPLVDLKTYSRISSNGFRVLLAVATREANVHFGNALETAALDGSLISSIPDYPYGHVDYAEAVRRLISARDGFGYDRSLLPVASSNMDLHGGAVRLRAVVSPSLTQANEVAKRIDRNGSALFVCGKGPMNSGTYGSALARDEYETDENEVGQFHDMDVHGVIVGIAWGPVSRLFQRKGVSLSDGDLNVLTETLDELVVRFFRTEIDLTQMPYGLAISLRQSLARAFPNAGFVDGTENLRVTDDPALFAFEEEIAANLANYRELSRSPQEFTNADVQSFRRLMRHAYIDPAHAEPFATLINNVQADINARGDHVRAAALA